MIDFIGCLRCNVFTDQAERNFVSKCLRCLGLSARDMNCFAIVNSMAGHVESISPTWQHITSERSMEFTVSQYYFYTLNYFKRGSVASPLRLCYLCTITHVVSSFWEVAFLLSAICADSRLRLKFLWRRCICFCSEWLSEAANSAVYSKWSY